jgi:DNA-binding MarR family transcriptional regulator
MARPSRRSHTQDPDAVPRATLETPAATVSAVSPDAPTPPPGDLLDERQLAAWRTLIYAHAAVVERVERDLAAVGSIPLATYDVLVALALAPERRLRMSELARAVVLNRSTLTRRVDRLEREGLLAREPCGDDGRGAYAVLTEAGRAAARAAWPVYARGIRDYFARHLTARELDMLARTLGRVRAAAEDGRKESQ